jgi:hypothetical protein
LAVVKALGAADEPVTAAVWDVAELGDVDVDERTERGALVAAYPSGIDDELGDSSTPRPEAFTCRPDSPPRSGTTFSGHRS